MLTPAVWITMVTCVVIVPQHTPERDASIVHQDMSEIRYKDSHADQNHHQVIVIRKEHCKRIVDNANASNMLLDHHVTLANRTHSS
jgi:hypothetical protein